MAPSNTQYDVVLLCSTLLHLALRASHWLFCSVTSVTLSTNFLLHSLQLCLVAFHSFSVSNVVTVFWQSLSSLRHSSSATEKVSAALRATHADSFAALASAMLELSDEL